jgi:hypothetical protein
VLEEAGTLVELVKEADAELAGDEVSVYVIVRVSVGAGEVLVYSITVVCPSAGMLPPKYALIAERGLK